MPIAVVTLGDLKEFYYSALKTLMWSEHDSSVDVNDDSEEECEKSFSKDILPYYSIHPDEEEGAVLRISTEDQCAVDHLVLVKLFSVCMKFLERAYENGLTKHFAGMWELAGADFVMTMNETGVSFLDGDWDWAGDGVAEALNEIAESVGHVRLYRGDDGKAYTF